MTLLRHFLLVALFVLAQLGANAHALEHTLEKGGVPPHACSLCLEAHDLGAALPSLPPVLPPPPATGWFVLPGTLEPTHLRTFAPRQGAPPTA